MCLLHQTGKVQGLWRRLNRPPDSAGRRSLVPPKGRTRAQTEARPGCVPFCFQFHPKRRRPPTNQCGQCGGPPPLHTHDRPIEKDGGETGGNRTRSKRCMCVGRIGLSARVSSSRRSPVFERDGPKTRRQNLQPVPQQRTAKRELKGVGGATARPRCKRTSG